jgi:hypothetical protein
MTALEKQEIDKKVLRDAEELYREIIFENDSSVLNKKHEKQMVSLLVIYCDDFYATDLDGKTICGHPIGDLKINDISKKIEKKNPNGVQYVALQYDNPNTEEIERKKLLTMAEQ